MKQLKFLNSPHISLGNYLLYSNFVVLMIFTEKLIYWIKKFFKFSVLEHYQCVWTQVSNFTGILLANQFFGVLSYLGMFPDTFGCMVLCFKILFFFFFLRGKAYKHIQRTNYKIFGIKIERQENYQLKNAVSWKNERLRVEFYSACSGGLILKAIPEVKCVLFRSLIW